MDISNDGRTSAQGAAARILKVCKKTQVCLLSDSNSQGSALVEMALAMPLMMLIMTGIFSFSNALYQKLSLSEGVSVGGRVLAVDRGDTDPCKTATAAIVAAAPSLNNSNMSLTYTLDGVSQGSGTTSCPGTSGAANADMVSGKNSVIQATYKCSLGVYGSNFGTCTINEQITEVVQ
jgi:Flp pilus assembly protein TadG